MLRVMRIVGVIIFSILIGLSANRLQRLYSRGELFERYNSERRANITLFIFSVGGLVVLGSLEYLQRKRMAIRRGYVPLKIKKDLPVENQKVTCIYSAPETIDKWDVRKTRSSRSRSSDWVGITDFWMRVLRVCCAVVPVAYLYILTEYVINWVSVGMGNLFLTVLVVFLFVLSGVTSFGVFRRKMWGVNCGYALAIFHLLIFPIGTAVGLLMLVSLAGATPEISTEVRENKRKARKEKRKNIRASMA